MQTVNLNREDLLKKIQSNRDIHLAEYKEAEVGYLEAVQEGLSNLLVEANDAKPGDELTTNLKLSPPQNHVADYDRVIRMLEMSVDTDIILTSSEFDQYVMDNWSWAPHAKMLNTMYASKSW